MIFSLEHRDIWNTILGYVDDAKTFYSLLLTCKFISTIAKTQIPTKKKQFTTNHRGDDAEYSLLPNGNFDGLYRQYNKSKIYIEKQFLNGVLHGEARIYETNGKLSHRCNYVDGKIEGPSETFISDKLYLRCHYIDGKLHGSWEEFHPQYKLHHYEHGKLCT